MAHAAQWQRGRKAEALEQTRVRSNIMPYNTRPLRVLWRRAYELITTRASPHLKSNELKGLPLLALLLVVVLLPLQALVATRVGRRGATIRDGSHRPLHSGV